MGGTQLGEYFTGQACEHKVMKCLNCGGTFPRSTPPQDCDCHWETKIINGGAATTAISKSGKCPIHYPLDFYRHIADFILEKFDIHTNAELDTMIEMVKTGKVVKPKAELPEKFPMTGTAIAVNNLNDSFPMLFINVWKKINAIIDYLRSKPTEVNAMIQVKTKAKLPEKFEKPETILIENKQWNNRQRNVTYYILMSLNQLIDYIRKNNLSRNLGESQRGRSRKAKWSG